MQLAELDDATSSRRRDGIGLAVIICTYHRPELLRETLDSLGRQTVPDDLRPTVYVVDNSDDGSAAAVVAAAAASNRLPMRWLEAHPANISVARNVGIGATDEPFVAFVDDDELCEAGWLEAVGRALRITAHDVLFGRVVANFENPDLPSDAVKQLFSRELDRADGHRLYAFGPDKLAAISLATCNSIFRRATTLTDEVPFDASFGVGGGEDYDLFCRLQRRGRSFGWLPAATVREFVPGARCEGRYLRRRFYAGGQAFAAAIARNSDNQQLTRWIVRWKAAAQGILLLLQLPKVLIRGGRSLDDYGYRWAGILGKLSFGGIYPLYRRDRN
ncbi:MAG: glycosyltransferase [Rhodopseudomonas sp.]|uniref:glycosyltransferase family 2 protein n=1 Tax=Rhodopseudomonas sp. TaxID=1078 RepID=UPI0017F790D9|nr:glycosyltransferase family 2 protein [Rhodopseudomonas sp.]NVN87192.1 glycosyltransferase [Rhodopseudomonas sp.]